MKKRFALLLALLLICTLTACGEGTITDSSGTGASSQIDTAVSSQGTASTPDINPGNQSEITFTELVVVDDAECTIKITGIDPDNMWGYTLNVVLENKSAKKTYVFSVLTASVNGVECDPSFASVVAAGKKANDEIVFMSKDLEENGVGDFTDIELTFRVYDYEDWAADDVANQTVHVYPYGEDKAVSFVRTPQATDQVIIDNDWVKVTVLGYEKDDIWGCIANLFLENKTDKNVMFSMDNASVNGYMINPFYATAVSAGKCAFSSASWSNKVLEDNDIDQVEELEFTLRVHDSDDLLMRNAKHQF